jgi:hypothetical protein
VTLRQRLRKQPWRLSLAAVLVLVLALVSIQQAAGLASPVTAGVPVLTKRVTLSGPRSGFLTVYLPNALRSRQVQEIRYSFSGRGHFVGMALRADLAPPRMHGHHPTLYEVRYGAAPPIQTFGGVDALPRGTYQLYFVSDASGRITMTIPGLRGTSSLHPEEPVRVPIQPLLVRHGNHQSQGVTVLGETRALSSDGFAIGYIDVHHPTAGRQAPSLDQVEFCTYSGPGAGRGPNAYEPGCNPAGVPGQNLSTADFASGGTQTDKAQMVGLGGNVKSSDPSPQIDAYGMWVSLASKPRS